MGHRILKIPSSVIPEGQALHTTISAKYLLQDFTSSSNTLRVYRDGKLVFSSEKDRVVPLLDYIDSRAPADGTAVFFDRITGNAAALLSVLGKASEIYSPLGSELGIQTLKKYGIEFQFDKVVPFIQKPDSNEMCFMEKLSTGKTPEEFYQAIKSIIK